MTTDTGTPLRGPPGAHAAALNRGRLQLILAQRPVLWAGNLGLQGCAVALLAAEHAPAPLLAWMLINVVLTTARIVSAARLRGRSWDDADIARWLRWQVAAAAAGGTIWGVGAWLFLHPQPPGTFLAFSVLLLGVSWGGAVALAPHYTAAFAWTVPFVGLAALRHATLDTSHASLLGTTTFAYLLFLLMTARNLNRAVSAKIVADAENVALLAAVSRARDDAVRASAEKTRFLAAISHDLRQPLYAARLFMDLQETQLTTAPQLSVHRRAQNALAALDDQFAALTDLARLDSGVLEPRVDDVALRPIIADLVAECRAVRTHHGAPGPTLQCRCADVVARTDAALFQRILRNLLDNALKFTERGSVTIDAREHHGTVIVAVTDTGMGIPAEHLSSIFDDYTQVPDQARERHAGSGLGLAVVKRLAKLLDAEVSVTSRPGAGSTFTVSLPGGDARAARTAPAPTPSARLDDLLVAVIENDDDIREGLQRLVASWGCIAVTAASTDELLALVEPAARPADVLIADNRLAHGNGLDAIRRLRATWDPALPAVLLTGDAQFLDGDVAGDIRVLRKPVSAAQLQATLVEVTGHAGGTVG